MIHSCKRFPFNVYALHGFLGLPSDWNSFPFVTHPVELNKDTLSLPAWGKHFNDLVPRTSQKNILLGYSMGGRLAMHALLENPLKWDACIFISAHTGLNSDEERLLRLQSDLSLTERVLKEPWENFLSSWNALPIFHALPAPFERPEVLFDRNQLSRQVTYWSLGHQMQLVDRLKQVKVPMLFIAGALDTKFCSLAEECHPFAKIQIVPKAAHRVPWDQPEKFMHIFNTFIKELL